MQAATEIDLGDLVGAEGVVAADGEDFVTPGGATAAATTARAPMLSEARAKAATVHLLRAVLLRDTQSKVRMRVGSNVETRSALAALGQSFTHRQTRVTSMLSLGAARLRGGARAR